MSDLNDGEQGGLLPLMIDRYRPVSAIRGAAPATAALKVERPFANTRPSAPCRPCRRSCNCIRVAAAERVPVNHASAAANVRGKG